MIAQNKSSIVLGVFLSIFCVFNVHSRPITLKFSTKWDQTEKRCIPCDFDESNQKVFTAYSKNLKLKGNYEFTYDVSSVNFKTVSFPTYYSIDALTENPEIKIDFGKARGEYFVRVYYFPLVKQNGVVSLVESVTLNIEAKNVQKSHDRSVVFASSSVLASGDWYKIGVSKTGVHKLDYNFLQEIGVDVSNLNPNSLNIYGNHFPIMPINNADYRPDDLLKNAIYISGASDNSFDAGDYILFYATGPDVVNYNSNSINVRKNHLDSMNYYFLHHDASDSPKRISASSSSSNPTTHIVNSFNDVVLYEKNDVNLITSGNDWLGELFDIELNKSISINLPGVNTAETVSLKTQIASNVKPSTTGSVSVRVNGVQQDNISCSETSGSYTEARINNSTVNFNVSGSSLTIDLTFTRSNPANVAWLDYLMFNYKRNSNLANGQILIRDLGSVGIGNVSEYTISSVSSSSFIWEVTDPANITSINGTLNGNNYTVKLNSDSLRSIAAFNSSQAMTPTFIDKISNQNLHGLSQVDYLIVAPELLMPQAERLASLHEANGTSVHVVDIQQVYNEFSGGIADPVAVRWIMKMFYQRAGGVQSLMPKYVCLFGDGTYDPLNRLENNNYLLPTYNNNDNDNSIDYVDSFTSDDFFGILDDTEAMSAGDMMDVAVGRLPVSTLEEAEDVVNKIEHYMNFGSSLYSNASDVQCNDDGYSSTFGDWRNRLVLMADDENTGQFVKDCEELSDSTEKNAPEVNIIKLYLDAYQQIATSGGQRYPDVEEAVDQNVNKGALIFNYVGHGGETGLTQERVITYAMIENWKNVNNLPVFISATCEFSRFDDPKRESAGERTLTSPYGGAIGLLTTTRLVYISLNTELVRNLYSVLFEEENGEALSIGEITRRTKNLTSATNNKRNFTVIGDPALKLGKPKPQVITDSLNSVEINGSIDSLKALSKITVTGHVEDNAGNTLSNFDGLVFPTVYDKWKERSTLGQDADSPVLSFETQNNIIYKGKSTVKNGKFSFSFVVPKDIDYSFGKGKISYYAHDDNDNFYGYDTSIVVGGVDPNGIQDDIGPDITLFMNDQNFVNGGITDESPMFIAEVSDENGINTTGNGIGHDITLILDGNTADPVILNNFYEADLDTYKSGKVSYQLSDLEPGDHQLTFKVWDVNNNSSQATLDFVVVEEQEIGISHVLNYPNPFTTNTDFFFEHNQVCQSMDVKIEIFTVSGKLVKTILKNVHTGSYRSEGINWDGRDDYGDRLGRGVYVYRLSVETPDGEKAEKLEKLVIL